MSEQAFSGNFLKIRRKETNSNSDGRAVLASKYFQRLTGNTLETLQRFVRISACHILENTLNCSIIGFTDTAMILGIAYARFPPSAAKTYVLQFFGRRMTEVRDFCTVFQRRNFRGCF
ncbi:MAG: hypothetical protein ACU0DI_07335 [Paracoccaceae bacterium]